MSENNLARRRCGSGLTDWCPVVAQESRSGDVLMVAFANREALERTAATGQAHYYSRSRAALWRKGETLGARAGGPRNPARLRRRRGAVPGRADRPRLPHRGPDLLLDRRSARTAVPSAGEDPGGHLLTRLAGDHRAAGRRQRPAGSYTAELLDRGVPKISQKVGEEAVEVVVAANAEEPERLASEAADLLYHLLVLLQARGVPLDAVWRSWSRRR